MGIPVSLGLTLVVQAPGLASANLLPRRVALHLTAVLMLLAPAGHSTPVEVTLTHRLDGSG